MAPIEASAVGGMADLVEYFRSKYEMEELNERALSKVTVVDKCPCGSPFLRRTTAPNMATCRTCCRVTILGRRERFPDAFPTGVVTTIHSHPDLSEGMVLARRWTVRGMQCESVVQGRPDDPGEPS